MANKAKKFYLTTAITYTSGKPHIGNTYEAIMSDSVARFKREEGYDVFFQTGTDEHGQKIEEKAAKAGKTPKEFVDEVAGIVKGIWDLVGVSYDKFIRTTDEYHVKEVQKIFRKLYEQGDIYKGSYEGWYCTPCESFWTESQLADGKCPDCGGKVVKAKEEAYFFKMSKYADRLMRKNEMVNNFLKPGLQDLCVSRSSFKWGIPVDFNDKHVVYVWLDALTNYITGIGYHADGNHEESYKKYWPADVHIIGKDIIRFHTIYWPIFLMALGEPLPEKVYGHGWLLAEGDKMSKSKGNVLYADEMVKRFGRDAVRYFALSAMPFDNDGLVSWRLVIEKINSDLANVFGNLVSRTAAMSNKYFGGIVENGGVNEPVDDELKAEAVSLFKKVKAKMDEYRVADALDEIFSLFRRANKYIDETAPWVLAKDEKNAARLKTVLYNLTEAIIIGVSTLKPFLPETAEKTAKIFGTELRPFAELGEFGRIAKVKVEEKPEILFARIDGEKLLKEIAAENEAKEVKETSAANADSDAKNVTAGGSSVAGEKSAAATEKTESKPQISIDEFAKVELKVAKVVACEKVEKSKKLLKLTVKLGDETRTVVSGISHAYSPEELIGKKLVMVANLKPAKLCGITSEGMILCAEGEDGTLSFLAPEKDVEDGSSVS